ncbi:Uncharacterised protein [Bordetella pertussis]|nr:Uncharacterised protein [Bordetella pertussis]CFW31669.1 Uncharacterised protein [Bordetella pertussis]
MRSGIVPWAGGYLVSPRCMAAMAASQICAGVEKSGSPTVRSMTRRPSSRSWATMARVATLGDSLMRLILSATMLIARPRSSRR